jgi:hypothetical protein
MELGHLELKPKHEILRRDCLPEFLLLPLPLHICTSLLKFNRGLLYIFKIASTTYVNTYVLIILVIILVIILADNPCDYPKLQSHPIASTVP